MEGPADSTTRPWGTIVSARTLRAVIDHPDLVVLDVRHDLQGPDAGRHAYEAGHIPGAVHCHVDRDLSGPVTGKTGRHPLPDPDAFRETMGRLGVGPGTQVVAYDDIGGAWAARAWWLLRHYGHDAVAVLDGGIHAWEEEGHPLREGPEENPQNEFIGNPGHLPVVDAASILARLPAARGTLIDARAGPRYRGEEEPIDPAAGHIPGALNAPFSENLGPDGRFLAPDELYAKYARLLAGRRASEVAAYCGSGVTASHALLSMHLAGLGDAALYAGSWSEWCSDPARPVATGEETDKETGDEMVDPAEADAT